MTSEFITVARKPRNSPGGADVLLQSLTVTPNATPGAYQSCSVGYGNFSSRLDPPTLLVVLSATRKRNSLVGLINMLPEVVASPSLATRVLPVASPAKMPSSSPAVAEFAPIVNELKI
jgi:hypothetical protein